MKKSLFLVPVLLGGTLLVSCNIKKVVNYTIDFKYNLIGNNSSYTQVIVGENDPVVKPADPETEDYIFSKWTTDAEGNNEYIRWGLATGSNVTLYAQWISFDSLTIDEKVETFQNKVSELGKDAVRVVQECQATIGYPGVISGSSGVFGVNDYYVYQRYDNITVKDYYSVDGNQKIKYGVEQFYYDTNYFYDIYRDYEDSTQNADERSKFVSANKNSYLSVDYNNLFKSVSDSIVYYSNSTSYDEETFMYEYTANATKVNSQSGNYNYDEGYTVSNYSESAGCWITEAYYYEYGFSVKYGKITSAIVNTKYFLYLDQDIYYYVFENSVYDFYYNAGKFGTYTGAKFVYSES